jgi:type IV pilus assembly protein PilM
LLPRRYGFIGIDIGARSVKAIQLSRAGKQARVEAAAVIPHVTDEPAIDAAFVRRLRDVFVRQGFYGNRVVLCAPSDKLHVEMLDLPPRHSGAPVDQLARAEMMRLSRLEGNSFEMATWDLPTPPRGGAGTALMAVAASHADTQGLFEAFESEGLTVEAIDVQACAIARACKPRQATTGMTAILDLGFSRASLWFIRDGIVAFQRTFNDCGTRTVQAELMKRLSVDADVADHLFAHAGEKPDGKPLPQAATVHAQVSRYVEAIGDELEASFAYINHRYSEPQPAALFAIGGGAVSGGVREMLGARLGTQVDALGSMSLVQCGPSVLEKCSSPVLTTALGLALYEGE